MQLYWDTTYAVAVALIEQYPDLDPVEIGLVELVNLVENLPNFADDTAVTERMLQDIQITWYEETTNP